MIDSRLTMSDQVIALCLAGYYQLCQLHPVARSLPEECPKTLVQAFISSRLDYCNALLRHQRQSVQASAVDPAGASRRDHISPVLRSLRWLPVKQRVDYKLATLVYKSMRGQAPSYVPGRRLPADRGLRTPPASLRSRQRSHFSENKHST